LKFLLDQDVPAEIGRVLARAGHDVVCERDVMSVSATDNEVFEYAVERGFVLVTCNRDDFIRLAAIRRHTGLIVVIRRKTRIMECAKLLHLLNVAGEVGITGNINFA
jgi:predicted nuclease of predicted toxin-antitoxin system